MLELVKQKGVYPFEYLDSFRKSSEDKLPGKCEFITSLKDDISEKDNVNKMNTIGDYHDLYLKTDALLLADVFERLINLCLE